MKKCDLEKKKTNLKDFEHSYIPATPHCGGYTESLACSQFLVFDWIFILAGNKDNYKSLNEFEFGQNSAVVFGVSCP